MADSEDPTPNAPSALQLMPFDEEFREDPHPRLKELRETCPVHREPDFDRVQVSSFEEVRNMLYDKKLGVDPRRAREDDPIRQFQRQDGGEPSMLFLDDPDHARLRNLVSKSFTPRRAEGWRSEIRKVATELLDAVDASGQREFDLIAALAGPLPAIAIARILGVDPAKQVDFKQWSETMSAAFFDPFSSEEDQAAALRAGEALDAVFRGDIEGRRAEPRDDLIGRMVRAEEEGDRLTEDELVTMCNLLLIAGNVTTTDLIGNGTRVLLQHPDQLSALRNDLGLVRNAVEEMIRFDPPVVVSGRITPDDMEIQGCPVHAGESMTAHLTAANRDPAANSDPDRFDIEREGIRYLSFGGGSHLCLGAHLARVEAQEAISALVARYPKLRSAGRDEVWKQVPGFRGLGEFWVAV
jgi:cytochrome P450